VFYFLVEVNVSFFYKLQILCGIYTWRDLEKVRSNECQQFITKKHLKYKQKLYRLILQTSRFGRIYVWDVIEVHKIINGQYCENVN